MTVPQLTVSGSPKPRKLMLASVVIAHAIANTPCTKACGRTFGAMCR
jgi:hypothetical protein